MNRQNFHKYMELQMNAMLSKHARAEFKRVMGRDAHDSMELATFWVNSDCAEKFAKEYNEKDTE